MFSKGLKVKDEGIDITFRNNPDHVLSPDDPDIILRHKFGKMTPIEFKKYYLELLASRFKTRRNEFIQFALTGADQDIKLLCYCGKKDHECHAQYAADFMNILLKKIKSKP